MRLLNSSRNFLDRWCCDRNLDHPVFAILMFQQNLLDQGSLRLFWRYVAAISIQHSHIDGSMVGGHKQVYQFLRGAWRLHQYILLRQHGICHWYWMPYVYPRLSPLETWTSNSCQWKQLFNLACHLWNVWGKLQALSNKSCLQWNSDSSGIKLWPLECFLPKVLSMSFFKCHPSASQFILLILTGITTEPNICM